MPGHRTFTIQIASPEDTAALARAIAPRLRAGDCILLEGQIGAGKTHFARALIQSRLAAADRNEDVPSPTFTIVQTYEDGIAEIWHADLYRINDPGEVDELGLVDAFQSAICLVEWPDRLGSAQPTDALRLSFRAGQTENSRILTLEFGDPRWQILLRGVAEPNVQSH